MTPAIARAEAEGLDFRVHELPVQGIEDAPGLPPERVFKTLIAELDGSRLVVAVLPLRDLLDLGRLASAAGAKRAALASAREAERCTGYRIGSISPLGQRRSLPTFLDESALGLETLFVSAGRRGLELELSPADLQRVCGAAVVRVARGRGRGRRKA